jgi:hypothetical protein
MIHKRFATQAAMLAMFTELDIFQVLGTPCHTKRTFLAHAVWA